MPIDLCLSTSKNFTAQPHSKDLSVRGDLIFLCCGEVSVTGHLPACTLCLDIQGRSNRLMSSSCCHSALSPYQHVCCWHMITGAQLTGPLCCSFSLNSAVEEYKRLIPGQIQAC